MLGREKAARGVERSDVRSMVELTDRTHQVGKGYAID